MIGLEYIVREFRKEYKEVANDLGVSKQTIQDWLKERRKIPAKRLNQLSIMFKLPEEYFQQKELTSIEKNNVRIKYLEMISKEEIIFLEENDEKTFYHAASPYQDEINIMKENNELTKNFHEIQKKISSVHTKSLSQVGSDKDDSAFHGGYSDAHAISEMLETLENKELSNYLKIFVYLINSDRSMLGNVEKRVSQKYKPFTKKLYQILNEEFNESEKDQTTIE
ncbi:helix-turn-helix transcriptional regulator [Exiguobacterium sp. FSL W8-0210]|uniref:helix-turn-helix domain-containing protein n=1 Tax=Exiguobacterium sp. FSL W8-0210 TaxID=2921598 RepID=UPI0030F7BD51